MTANIVILQLVVLAVVLESDLGRRKIGWFRVLRPVIAVVLIVPAYFTSVPSGGSDLALQAFGALAGAALGLISVCPALVAVYYGTDWHSWFQRRVPAGRKPAPVSRAGGGYATIWIAVTVARLLFAYGSQHWFPGQLGTFLLSHQISALALTNAFIFLAVGMDLMRSVGLWVRGRRARQVAAAPALA